LDIALSIPIETAPGLPTLVKERVVRFNGVREREKKGKEFLRGYTRIKALLSRIDQVKMR